MKEIYLDCERAAQPSIAVLRAMTPFLHEHFADPMSPYSCADEQRGAVNEAMHSFGKLFSEKSENILFCSSEAEAVNAVIFGVFLDVVRRTGKNHMVTSMIAKAPMLLAMHRLEPLGLIVKQAPVCKEGYVSIDALKETISPRTVLISLSLADGLTGVLQPLDEISSLCKERSIFLHIDVTHALGKVPLNLEADFITFGGGPLHGPLASGILWTRPPLQLSPFIAGGTFAACAEAVGLGVAVEEMLDNQLWMATEGARLRAKLEEGLLDVGAISPFASCERLPNCTSLLFPGVCNEALLYLLMRKKVFASFGGGLFQKIGLVLSACGIDEDLAHSALSFSLCRDTTEEQIDEAIAIIIKSVRHLLKIRGNL